jgi:ubiquinone/menaquinone biosynthesis C-methylase UbiE
MNGKASGKNANKSMVFTAADWHRRYQQQAGWSKIVRDHIFLNLNLPISASILEVGCGTGAVLADYSKNSAFLTFGLDIEVSVLQFGQKEDPRAILTCGDALTLPFANASFDLTFCHYLLLWLKDPLSAIKEMKRVSKPGGYVCAFAEPDYGGRIAYPANLVKVTDLQTQSLMQQGANPNLGRQLRHLFIEAKLSKVQVGVLAAEWNESIGGLESEIEMITNDLALLEEKRSLTEIIDKSQFPKDSIYFIPTFYAYGQVD